MMTSSDLAEQLFVFSKQGLVLKRCYFEPAVFAAELATIPPLHD